MEVNNLITISIIYFRFYIKKEKRTKVKLTNPKPPAVSYCILFELVNHPCRRIQVEEGRKRWIYSVVPCFFPYIQHIEESHITIRAEPRPTIYHPIERRPRITATYP